MPAPPPAVVGHLVSGGEGGWLPDGTQSRVTLTSLSLGIYLRKEGGGESSLPIIFPPPPLPGW